MTCHGVPEVVIVRGKVCVENGKVVGTKGWGQFVPNLPYASFVYDPVRKRDAVRKNHIKNTLQLKKNNKFFYRN